MPKVGRQCWPGLYAAARPPAQRHATANPVCQQPSGHPAMRRGLALLPPGKLRATEECASGASLASRIILMLEGALGRSGARQAFLLWSRLSDATHPHPYELAPTASELRRWHREATQLVSQLAAVKSVRSGSGAGVAGEQGDEYLRVGASQPGPSGGGACRTPGTRGYRDITVGISVPSSA